MPDITSLFVTRLYRATLNELAKKKVDYAELHQTCEMVAEDDEAGQEWCEANGYPGYTSYASLDDLPWRMPIFGDLEKALDKIRRHGIAYDDEEAELGLRCVAAPIHDEEGNIVAALSVSAPTDRHDPTWATEVKLTANAVSQALGFRGHSK